MRVHLLAVPNTRTTRAYPLDGFCVRTMLFAKLLMRLGHEVFLYGVEENEAPCTDFTSCLTAGEQMGFIGSTPYQGVPFEAQTPLFVTFNTRAAHAIRAKRKDGSDIIATIAGSSQHFVSEWHPELRFLEYSIGYRGVAAPFRVFESQAWRHTVYGFTGVDGMRPFDAVIYPWFDAGAMPYRDQAEDYVAYCGRITTVKGLQMACAAAQQAGVRLVIMGHGDPSILTYGEFAGAVSMEDRNRILSGARAVLMPTQYVEPFGNVAAEAQLCGTPVIASDWGAFTESVEPGVSGFRCNTLGEYAQAIDLAAGLDRSAVRARAVRLFGEDAAARAYTRYFARLDQVHRDGQNSLVPTLDVGETLERMYEHRSEQPVAG